MTGTPTDPDDANHTTLYDPTADAAGDAGSSTGVLGPAGDAGPPPETSGPPPDLGPTARPPAEPPPAAPPRLAAVGVHVALP